jgi:outer membrane protein assembly factor BamB
VVDCLDAALGLLHWSQRRATDYVDSFGFDNGPRAVPVSNGEIVVTHGPDGAVSAFLVADGEPLWSLDTAQLFEAPSGFFGRASSPLILEDKLILTPGGRFQDQPAGVVAISLQTGTLRWTSVADEASYSSPTLTPEKNLLCWMRNQVWLLDPADGRVKASQALRSSMDASVNASQPLFTDSKEVLLSAGYGVGLHRLSLPELLPVSNHDNLMDAHYSSPILHRGHLFGMHGRAETGQTLRCISLAPPAIRWDAGDSLPGGTFILVGEHLFLMTEQGELWAADATTDKLRLHYREQFLRSGHRAHLAYARGVLYARDSQRLVAIRVHE